ncbi:diguanylate cyclase (GGDEF)-like protein [Novosphingobium sp. SG751A]|uniref:GGDEF domain-containing protein n=1 Tax=Novosphingobium sp. SG751A TaxID=2587000 RepID=UPI001C12998B|nr:GGDEF domain-containing protein [Novosphingobium sp. SG751A]NOW46497.1 diguanylate cyclase (GGDEF)-like protein [Novosphingobium sp. SG751A]
MMEWVSSLAHAGTLLIVNALLAGLSCALFLALWITRFDMRNARALGLWSSAYALIAAGFTTLILPAFHIDFTGLALVGNLFIDAGAIMALLGINAYFRRGARDFWAVWPALALGAAEILWTIMVGEDYRMLVILGGSLRVIVTIASGIALWNCLDDTRRMVARIAGSFHFIWALMLLIRVAWWLVHTGGDHSVEPTSTFGLMSRLVLTWGITPSYLWMLTRQLDAELIRHALQDPLTGIANRRVIWSEGERRAAQPHPNGPILAVVMLDVDHFKAINDRWGHAVGDEVLIGIAQVLSQSMREGDLLARIGGEEFMVLLNHDNTAIIGSIAQRLREAVEAWSYDLPSGDTVTCTVSVGYSTAVTGKTDWKALVALADSALYAAKNGGRNRVVQGGADMPPKEAGHKAAQVA